MIKERPTFKYKLHNKLYPIRAGGILFYRYVNDNLVFLMIKRNNIYSDFGGKTEPIDKSIIDTASRETEEESNKIFKKNMIINIIRNQKGIYCKHSKYVIYLYRLDKYINPRIFGKYEKAEGIRRTVEWISYKYFIRNINKIHVRLQNKYLLFILSKL
jgi:hypothetical protein